MAKRKTKRNPRRSQARHGFKIRHDPVVQLAGDSTASAGDCLDPTRLPGQPFLFAIARDPRTVFASWNVDWRFVFKEAMPADRHVHLRVIGGNGAIETRVTVEPMCATHCVTIFGLHDSYRVEIGYFQPVDIWHSVATSDVIKMPSQENVELADVDLATIPFHITFQQLANLFGTTNDTSIARVVSELQKRLLNNREPHEATRLDKRILSSLNLSLDQIAAAERDFRKIDSEKLARHTRAMFQVGATSPVQGFQANPGS